MKQWIFNRIMQMTSVYHKGHLYHADNSLYMGRYSLFETKYLSARVHQIATGDNDQALHDHPWSFLSIVLSGGYVEELPLMPTPCWNGNVETTRTIKRKEGSISFRPASCRHRITSVEPYTWTLFIYGKFKQDWGFYTKEGKIFWEYYLAHQGAKIWSKENDAQDGDYVKAYWRG